MSKTDFDVPVIQPASLAEMVIAAARHWDGASEDEWHDGEHVLAEQVDTIYGIQHQDWHDGVLDPKVVKGWISRGIRDEALSLRDYLEKRCTCASRGMGKPRWDSDCPEHGARA